MSDIVEVFETYADSYGWQFSYGNKYNQNLLQSDLVGGRVYMILDPVTRVRAHSQYGGTGDSTFTGSFLLVVKSTIDQVYHNQQNDFVPPVEGKYNQNIKPLLTTEIIKLENELDCSAYEITNWSIIDVVNALDINVDGILVTFGVKILS